MSDETINDIREDINEAVGIDTRSHPSYFTQDQLQDLVRYVDDRQREQEADE